MSLSVLSVLPSVSGSVAPATEMPSVLRVRQILSGLQSGPKAALKKLLPKCAMPEVATGKYPSALLSIFPKAESYSLLGCVAEEVLRASVADITFATLWTAVLKWFPAATEAFKNKVSKSKTTAPFLDHLKATRTALDAVVKGDLRFDTEVGFDKVQGHPDAQTETQIFEVKMTGLLKKNWGDFLFQLFAYGALHDAATDLYLVLPLQSTVWHVSITGWKNRLAYRTLLNTEASRRMDPAVEKSVLPGLLLQAEYRIGSHVSKEKTLLATVSALPLGKPYQIFLSSALSSHMNIKDEDIAGAAGIVLSRGTSVFVHSQYMINLCATPGEKDDYGVVLLQKNLRISAAAGFKGVVVHVGKSTKMALDVAMANMRTNVLASLEAATVACPLLLETPAGQGTETLTTYDSFVGFVKSIGDPRLRICVDTCHVFASGLDPLDYLRRLVTEDPALLSLVHFNDSCGSCGSCVDRHAFIGTGEVGIEKMRDMADLCLSHSVPMLVE